MVFNRIMCLLILMLLYLSSSLYGASCYYVIKKDDTLTNILKNFGVSHVGRSQIKVLTASNFPTILKKGDLIYPDTVIAIPRLEVSRNHQSCLRSGHHEVMTRTQADCSELENKNTKIFPEPKSITKSKPVHSTRNIKKSTIRTEFNAGATWSRLDGTEKKNMTEGSFLNELSPNYSLDVAYRFSKRFEVIASAGLTYYLFEEAPAGNFINDTRFLAEFYGLGIRYVADSWGKLSLHLERRGELNYIIPVINNIEMSVDHVIPVRLEYEIDILAKSSWDLYLSGKAEFLFGDVVAQGFSFQLGAKLGYQFMQSAIHLTAHWHQQYKESDFLEMEQREIIASLSYSHFINGGSY